jgi:hypothetical protein
LKFDFYYLLFFVSLAATDLTIPICYSPFSEEVTNLANSVWSVLLDLQMVWYSLEVIDQMMSSICFVVVAIGLEMLVYYSPFFEVVTYRETHDESFLVDLLVVVYFLPAIDPAMNHVYFVSGAIGLLVTLALYSYRVGLTTHLPNYS